MEQRRNVPDLELNRISSVAVRIDQGDEKGSREVLWDLRKVCSDYSDPSSTSLAYVLQS